MISDKAHFHLGGFVNKQNCRILSSENEKMIFEKPLQPQRVTVWCGFWAEGIIIFVKMKLKRLFRWMDCAIEP